MDGIGAGHFLPHGSLLRDKSYAVSSFSYRAESLDDVVVGDVNALKAVAVPEPSAALLLLVAASATLGLGFRCRAFRRNARR